MPPPQRRPFAQRSTAVIVPVCGEAPSSSNPRLPWHPARVTDLRIPADLLREQLHALAALAQRLCRDRHDAEDAVQDTLVAALLRPAPRARRSWLAAILHNRVRQNARAELRRRARLARAGRPEPAPATADVVAELALHRRLVELVHALDAPLRQTLFLRFWRGLSARDIAALTATPVATVHARIERGLLRLRAELDAGPGGRAWAALLLALPAPQTLPGLAAALLMKTKVLLSVSLAIAVLCVLPFVDLGGGGVTAPAPAAPEPASSALPREQALAEPERRAVTAGSLLPAPAPLAGVPTVTGYVRDLDGRPVANIAVRFERTQREGTLVPDAEVPTMTTAADGSFTLGWPGREGWLVGASAEWAAVRRAWCAIEPPAQPPVVLVAPARRYAGSVVDPDGVPAPGAKVSVVLDEGIVAPRTIGGTVVALPNNLGSVPADAHGHFALGPVGFVQGMRLVAELPPLAPASIALLEA